jgi:hypothetical protein
MTTRTCYYCAAPTIARAALPAYGGDLFRDVCDYHAWVCRGQRGVTLNPPDAGKRSADEAEHPCPDEMCIDGRVQSIPPGLWRPCTWTGHTALPREATR